MEPPRVVQPSMLFPPPDPATRIPARPVGWAAALGWTAPVRRPLIAIVAMGLVGAVYAGRYPITSVGFVLAVAAWGAIVVVSLIRHRDAGFLGVLAIGAFLPWFVWRASPWLLVIDLLAFLGVGLHALSRRDSVFRSTLGGYLGQWLSGFGHAFTGGAVFWRALRVSESKRSKRTAHFLKQAIIPAAVVLGALGILAAGDQLFASYLSFSISETIRERVAFFVFGTIVFLIAVGASARPAPDGEDDLASEHPMSFPSNPVLLTVVGLAIVLFAYGAVQLSAAFLGASYVRERTGLSYAEWARQGFASIAVVAVVSTVVLGSASVVVARKRERRRSIQIVSVALALAVCGIALSSILKLAVYTDQYGLTMLRLYTITFTGWLGLVALIQLVAIWLPRRSWLTSAVFASALVGAFAMNFANPERIVIETNIDRAASGIVVPGEPVCDRTGSNCFDDFDPYYAANLSADAVSVALERLDELPVPVRAQLLQELCDRDFHETGGFGYNRSIARAREAQRASGCPVTG